MKGREILETNLLAEQEIGNPRQDIRVGDTITWIIKTRCIDNYDVTVRGGIEEADDLDVASLRLDVIAHFYGGISCQELDELRTNQRVSLNFQRSLQSIYLTDDFPVPVPPIMLLHSRSS